MKRNLPLKPLLFSCICIIIIFLLPACVLDPIDVDYEQDGPSVTIRPGSDTGIIAGDGRITVDPNKYYMIEEFDADGDSVGPVQFVTSGGGRAISFSSIGRVTGGVITGLNNDYSYLVKSAVAYTSTALSYNDGGTTASKTPTADGLELPATATTLDISPIITGNTLQVIKSQVVNPAVANTDITGQTTITLEGTGTTTDYVFAEHDSTDYTGLKVLRVKITNPATLVVNVDLNGLFDIPTTILPTSPNTDTVTQTFLLSSTYTINLTGAPSGSTFQWYYNGASPVLNPTTGHTSNGSSFTIDIKDDYTYMYNGRHIFTVYITVSSRTYTAHFTLTVNP